MKKILAGVIAGTLLLGSCIAFAADDAGYVASKNSNKYHLATCSVAKKIDPANKVTFKTPEEAIGAGYSPCMMCNPPTTSAKSAMFVGSKGSDKYHVPTCAMAQKITDANKVTFASADEAKKAGYSPCQICCKSTN